MKLLFLLSGEHPELPHGEARACLEALGIEYSTLIREGQVLVVEATVGRKEVKALAKRLAMSHRLGRLCFSSPYDELDYKNYALEFEGSFAVRVWKLGKVDVNASYLERKIGERITSHGKRVDLSAPENLFLGIAAEKLYLALSLAKVPRGDFERRRPHLRPYYHPGAISPRLSRAIVNLTRVRPSELLADPFCGSGSFLIEAGLIGARLYGFDVDGEAIEGAERNLEQAGQAGIHGYHLEVKNFLEERFTERFHAVVADPPYGLSSSMGGMKREEFYQKTVEKMGEILKPGRYACLVLPKGTAIDPGQAFKLIERYDVRVHRSLTREILVMRKWR